MPAVALSYVGLRSFLPLFLVCCAVHPRSSVRRAVPLTTDEVLRQGCSGYWRTAVMALVICRCRSSLVMALVQRRINILKRSDVSISA